MWGRGDVLKKGRAVVVVDEITSEGYNVIRGPALLYSETNWPKDPKLLEWKKIDELGKKCSHDDIINSLYVKGA